MALRTRNEFREGLRDARAVYVDGARIDDVTTHPALAVAVDHAANIYDLATAPDTAGLFTCERGGETVNRYFEPLTSADALVSRARLIEEHTAQARTTLNLTKAVGTDALNALTAVAPVIDRAEGTDYVARVAAYFDACVREDSSVVLAQTDAKGDRRLRPNEQPDPDLYVRIVERRADGIVVQGAKAHTTMAPVADEVIVLPTRAMGPDDADYAVAFALPVSTPGVEMICGPLPDPEASVFDSPVSSRNVEIESLTVFDGVFVPWERVFLAGEYQHAGAVATTFATYHRFTATAYKIPFAEVLLACGVMIAELNGTIGASHVSEKLARLIHYGTLLRACVDAAARNCVPAEAGQVLPAPVFTNVGKYHFASQFHAMCAIVQDLAGGFAITAPNEASLRGEHTGPLIRKYLQGAAGTDAELRLRVLHLIRDLTASDFGGYNYVVTLHGEGSMQAQLMQTLRDADLQPALELIAHILEEDVTIRGGFPRSALPVVA